MGTGNVRMVWRMSVNLNDCLRSLYVKYRKHALKKGIDIRYDTSLDDSDSEIWTDGSILTATMSTLLGNSFHNTESGYISFGYMIKKDLIEFFISDTGKGINKEVEADLLANDRLTEKLVNTNYDKANELINCGLNVKRLGGKFWMQTDPHDGTVYYFTIPFEKAWE